MTNSTSNGPKHRKVFQMLREEVLRGQHGLGQRLPSEHQLVQRFGVSRATVIRALRDLAHEGLVERRVGSGTYVCGRPEKKNGAFALLTAGDKLGGISIWGAVAATIANQSQAHGHPILWMNLPNSEDWNDAAADQMYRDLLSRGAQGIFFAPPIGMPWLSRVNLQFVERLAEAGLAVLLLDSDVAPYPERSRFDVVSTDNRRAGYVLARHLLGLGVRRIDFVTRRNYPLTAAERILGCQDAMREAGIEPSAAWIHYDDPHDAQVIAAALEESDTDAVVCINDDLAIRAIRALEERGLHVPKDIRVASFDDVQYAALVTPPLTTMRHPREALGHLALETLLQRIEEAGLPPRTIELTCELVVRQSCGEGATSPRTSKLTD